ncbi:MAG: MotA/TolQ/ExbB proton channel family protein [Methanotrichaceae archaeon]|nr:MotA/TolQ/ExbB proton channel family protein [Methanotrichaceae archaeon]
MSLYEASVGLLYIFSTALLYPVIAGLLLMFAWSLALLGSLINEYTSRRRILRELEDASMKAGDLTKVGRAEEAALILKGYKSPVQVMRALEELARSLEGGLFQLKFEKILQDAELSMAKALDPMRIGAKAGPILGLMGTLIPMGPALIGLSQGDIRALADNLVIAFATTVIGLVVGGICYGALIIKSRWYGQDLSDLEYVVEIIRGKVDEAT